VAAIDQLELLAGRKAADRPSAAAPTAAADADEDNLPIPSSAEIGANPPALPPRHSLGATRVAPATLREEHALANSEIRGMSV
jgi:hypothetical protein